MLTGTSAGGRLTHCVSLANGAIFHELLLLSEYLRELTSHTEKGCRVRGLETFEKYLMSPSLLLKKRKNLSTFFFSFHFISTALLSQEYYQVSAALTLRLLNIGF